MVKPPSKFAHSLRKINEFALQINLILLFHLNPALDKVYFSFTTYRSQTYTEIFESKPLV